MGLSFTSGASLLTIIQTQLTSAGWVLTSSAANTITMRGQTTNGHQCWVRFSISGSQLIIRGDLTGAGTTLSPDSILFVNFDAGQDNRIFITADDDSAAISVIPFSQPADGFHIGFLDRRSTADQFAWMVGRILDAVDSSGANHLTSANSNGYANAYVARETHTDSVNWRLLGSVFDQLANAGFTPNAAQPLTTTDVVTQVLSFSSYTTASASALSYYRFFGGVERDSNVPIIAPYYYLEGYGASTQYGSTTNGLRNANNLYFRGFVKHSVTGMASFAKGVQWNSDTNRVYMSVGDRGWQGMRVA